MVDRPYRQGDPLLTIEEIAKELRHHPRQTLRMCAQGLFPGAFRTGIRRGVWRIPRSGLEAYILERQQATERVTPKRRTKAKAKA